MENVMPVENNEYSNIIFLLDETGSMNAIKNDTIGGFNSFLETQKKLGNKIKFSLTLFNSHDIEKRYVKVDINDVEELTADTYNPRDTTPLNDAIGKTITDNADLEHALVVILTDGEENSSKEYTLEAVKKLIEEKQNSGWTFLYLGVDIANYHSEASSRGIAYSVGRSGRATMDTYRKMSDTVSAYSSVNNLGKKDFDAAKLFNEDDEK